MAVAYNSRIVTDGLVLALDAANSKSYNAGISTTTWTDLSGNGNNGTLVNSVGYNSGNLGSLTFDGVSAYISVSGSITTSAATFIAWINRNGNQVNYAGIVYCRSNFVSGMEFFGTTNKIGYTWNGDVNTYNWDSGLVTPNLSWCMCAISVSSSSATAYLGQSSGISSSTNIYNASSTTLNNIMIGNDPNSPGPVRYFNGNIAQVSIYNRALSAQEIQQNFNATRRRYGI